MAHLSNKKYIWALPILVIIIILFILFKPSSSDTVRENIQPIANNQVQKIRIAVPDLSSSDKSSSGTPLIDNLYLNQLLQQEFAADNIQVEWQFLRVLGLLLMKHWPINSWILLFWGIWPQLLVRQIISIPHYWSRLDVK